MKLKEIAELAGVSIATASYAVNGKAKQNGISEETARRVRKIARDHGFVPNRTAVFLKKGRYHLFALVAPHFTEFFSDLVQSVELEGEKHDYQVLFSSTFKQVDREREYLRSLLARRVDGIIIMPTDVRAPHLLHLYQNDMPVVLFRHRGDSDLPYKFMSFDDVQGASLAAEHLLDRGCERLAFCSVIDYASFNYIKPIHETRVDGLRQVLESRGKTFSDENLLFADCTRETAMAVVEQIKARRIDGILGISSDILMSLIVPLREAGLRVPDDVKLVSFDESILSQVCDPPLTSLRSPKTKMGESMVQALLRMIESGEQEEDEVLYPFDLVVRRSSE